MPINRVKEETHTVTRQAKSNSFYTSFQQIQCCKTDLGALALDPGPNADCWIQSLSLACEHETQHTQMKGVY